MRLFQKRLLTEMSGRCRRWAQRAQLIAAEPAVAPGVPVAQAPVDRLHRTRQGIGDVGLEEVADQHAAVASESSLELAQVEAVKETMPKATQITEKPVEEKTAAAIEEAGKSTADTSASPAS